MTNSVQVYTELRHVWYKSASESVLKPIVHLAHSLFSETVIKHIRRSQDSSSGRGVCSVLHQTANLDVTGESL
jgi:hypothetical protein